MYIRWIHADRVAVYYSIGFNDYLANQNFIHSMSQSGYLWKNLPMEHWWNDFELIWLEKCAQSKILEKLGESVKEAIKYFNMQRAYESKSGLTVEKFRVQTA